MNPITFPCDLINAKREEVPLKKEKKRICLGVVAVSQCRAVVCDALTVCHKHKWRSMRDFMPFSRPHTHSRIHTLTITRFRSGVCCVSARVDCGNMGRYVERKWKNGRVNGNLGNSLDALCVCVRSVVAWDYGFLASDSILYWLDLLLACLVAKFDWH